MENFKFCKYNILQMFFYYRKSIRDVLKTNAAGEAASLKACVCDGLLSL